MRVVWVLTVLHLVAAGAPAGGANAIHPAEMPAAPSRAVQTEQVTIGIYASKANCDRMRAQLANAAGFKPGSAQCNKQLN